MNAPFITVGASLRIASRYFAVRRMPAGIDQLREALGLKADDILIAETTPEGLLLRPAATLPVEMYSAKRVHEFDKAEAELAKTLAGKGRKKPAR